MGDPDIKDFKKKYDLDDQAARKLAEAKAYRSDTWATDCALLHKHLETSNKPSARVMMMLSKLRSKEPLPEPDARVAPGSYRDRMDKEAKAKEEKKSRSRSRGRSRGRRRRSRTRSRDRRKSRSRDR